MPKFQLPRHVFGAEVDGVIFILDVKSDAYFALEPSATTAWHSLASGNGLAEERDNEQALLVELTNLGLLDKSGGVETTKSRASSLSTGFKFVKRWPIIQAWLTIVATARRLQSQGLAIAYMRIDEIGRQALRPRHITLGEAQKAFVRAEGFFLSRRGSADCLPRSLALFEYLTFHCGLSARHCIGVKRYPFVAHAWVEADGHPLLDDSAMISEFTVLSSVEAPQP